MKRYDGEWVLRNTKNGDILYHSFDLEEVYKEAFKHPRDEVRIAKHSKPGSRILKAS